MHVRVLKPFDYTPSAERRVTFAYQPGEKPITVKREAGEAMIAAGAAEEVEPFNGADPTEFDHDGDGKPGGSLPKGKAKA